MRKQSVILIKLATLAMASLLGCGKGGGSSSPRVGECRTSLSLVGEDRANGRYTYEAPTDPACRAFVRENSGRYMITASFTAPAAPARLVSVSAGDGRTIATDLAVSGGTVTYTRSYGKEDLTVEGSTEWVLPWPGDADRMTMVFQFPKDMPATGLPSEAHVELRMMAD